MTRLFLVAGEPSGDALGAALLRDLRAVRGEALDVSGVGGPLMAQAGMPSLFPQHELAVMGLVEVLPALPRVLRRMAETVAAARAFAPDALVTIDSPAFSLRVAERLRRAAPGVRLTHYVAPSVWAWRPGRARRLAARVDQLLALFPFEPPLFDRWGLRCDFVGHPAVSAPQADAAQAAAFRADQPGAAAAPLLLVLPGSRAGEVRRLLAPMAQTVAQVARRRPGLRVAIPTTAGVAAMVRDGVRDWPTPVTLIEPGDAARKRAAFVAADAALAASGTVTLELAAAGVPMVSVYRVAPLTAAIVRRLVSVDTANLVNIVAGRPVAPEFLQERFSPEAAAAALTPLLAPGPEAQAQRKAFAAVRAALSAPPMAAARAVLDGLGDARSAPGATHDGG